MRACSSNKALGTERRILWIMRNKKENNELFFKWEGNDHVVEEEEIGVVERGWWRSEVNE